MIINVKDLINEIHSIIKHLDEINIIIDLKPMKTSISVQDNILHDLYNGRVFLKRAFESLEYLEDNK